VASLVGLAQFVYLRSFIANLLLIFGQLDDVSSLIKDEDSRAMIAVNKT
jgi:hypothetical protein